MRTLMFTAGSPFARAVRVILDELELPYEGQEPDAAPTAQQLGTATPTMQVPTLCDGDVTLWESGTIAEYLLTTYTHRPQVAPPLAEQSWRPGNFWHDKLIFSTIQTFGTAAATISQLTWTGVSADQNPHLQRCAERMALILDWLEESLPPNQLGFFPDCVSMQDIFLTCHVRFVQARPLRVELNLPRYEKISRLVTELDQRQSFKTNPIWWWDPEVTGYEKDGTPIYPAE